MPSSRGGGHSGGGGGSHGGFSGGGSHGGGFSGGGRPSGPRFDRRREFPGSRRYSYYYRGRSYFFFYGGTPVRQNPWTALIASGIFAIVGIIFAVIFFSALVPHKLSSSKCEFTGSYYEDNCGFVNNPSELNQLFEKFYKKTGVQPYLYTFRAEDFPSQYGTLGDVSIQDYAWQIYIDRFDDEGHYLIVYTQDESGSFWYWAEMAGDDTDKIITDDYFEEFQTDMQKYLNKTGGVKGDEFIRAFGNLTDNVMKLDNSQKLIVAFLCVFFLIFIGVPLASGVSNFKKIQEINRYCDYRDGHGGDYDAPPPHRSDASDLFD